MKNFSNTLKSLRVREGLTQGELADKLKISRSTIGMYEQGEREPSFEMLEKIADFFNVDMNYLSGDAGESYYVDLQTKQIAQEIFENEDMKTLFHVARTINPEKLKAHIEFMKALMDKEDL